MVERDSAAALNGSSTGRILFGRGLFSASPLRGVAQPGSAPALGAGSRRFKSSHPDQCCPCGRPDRWVARSLPERWALMQSDVTDVTDAGRSVSDEATAAGRPRPGVWPRAGARHGFGVRLELSGADPGGRGRHQAGGGDEALARSQAIGRGCQAPPRGVEEAPHGRPSQDRSRQRDVEGQGRPGRGRVGRGDLHPVGEAQ